MQREFPTAPIAGVGAVVLDAERRVLLVQRGQPPLLGVLGGGDAGRHIGVGPQRGDGEQAERAGADDGDRGG